MAWGGLRGAISLALALSLPAALGPDRDLLRTMAFGVVLFTLLVQATTMKPLIRRLKIVTRSDTQVEYETTTRGARQTRARPPRAARSPARAPRAGPIPPPAPGRAGPGRPGRRA